MKDSSTDLAQIKRSGADRDLVNRVKRSLKVRGKYLQDVANHRQLLIAGFLAEFQKAFPAIADAFVAHRIERDAHDAERLREIVDDAVKENFFFLNLALQPLVLQKRSACCLKQLRAFAKLRFRVMQSQKPLAIQLQRDGL